MDEAHKAPYKSLGTQLRKLRERRLETITEVSGSVEIGVNELTDIENGIIRPSEDVLSLLISHFSPKDHEVVQLWQSAGYDDSSPSATTGDEQYLTSGPAIVVMPIDARIVYTDMVHVMVNNYGVVMNFMQSAGPGNQPMAIARVGMSKEHAKSTLEVLKQTLDQAEKSQQPKLLPQPKNQKKES